MRCCAALVVTLLIVATGASVANAQTQYWDIDVISHAGAGSTTPTGIWSANSTHWNTDSTGLGIPTTWTAGNEAVFSAGTNATGTYTVTVSGTQSLSGLTVEEGFVTQSGGTLAFGSATAQISVASGAGYGQTTTSVITGTGGVVKSGAGVLALRGTNTFSRTGSGNQAFLTINGGTVDFQLDANLGAVPTATDNGAALSINGGTLRYSGTSTFSLAANRGVFVGASGATFEVINSVTLALPSGAPAANTLTGTGTITKTGAGRFRLQTAQTTFTGKYVVKAGSLTFPSQDRLGAIPATTQADYFTLDGGGIYGDLSTGATLDAKRGITLGPNGGYLAFVGTGLTPYDGIISGTQGGGLSVTTTDAMGSRSSGTVSLNSANTYDGPTLIASGMTLSVGILVNGGVNSGIGSSSNAATNLILDGGTLLYRGAATTTDRNFTITATAPAYIDASGASNAPLTFTNTAPISLTGSGLHIFGLRGTSTGDNTLSQSIADQGNSATTLNKLDAGSWVLKNTANAYTGNTAISGGRLKLGNSGVIPDLSLVQLFTGATFDLNGFDETVRSVSGTAGTIALGSKTLTLSNANGEIYSGAITSSNGRILKNGAGKLTLGTTATYDGGVTTNAGKLGIGTNFALGSRYFGVNNSLNISPVVTSPLTLTNSVVLNGDVIFDDYSFISNPGSITWNTSGTNHWTLYGGNRMIAVSSVPGTYGLTINQSIGEDIAGRDLIKGGNGLLALNGVNTYTGKTIVQGGVLKLGTPSLFDESNVVLAAGATLNLSFSASTPDTINAFYIDGVKQTDGIWGAIGSSAPYQTASITGTGLLIVTPFDPPISSTPLAGDFNNDGIVDAGDYVTWRKANGTNSALLNDNGLGTPIGQAHLDLWRQHFGNVTGAGSGSSSLNGGMIPEPNTMMLVIIGIAGLASTASRRKR